MKPTICLNMIVKSEAKVIRRCLDSVRPFIDHWIIVDTGSTDGTQDLIREILHDLPGTLIERPWRDFGQNRTEGIELARGKSDYILVMDADNTFHAPDGWTWPALTGDAYHLSHHSAGVEFAMCILVSDRLRWRYVGVLHEYITSDTPHRIETLKGPWVDRRHEGARSRDPDTFRKDAAILEKALAAEPGNARYAFYLAQSWRDANEPARALEAYRVRAVMPGWDEETWYALYEIARLSERLGAPLVEIQGAYLAAYQNRPRRAEPLHQLARLQRERGKWALARLFARAAREIPRPDDLLFVNEATYRWGADDEAAVAAYWTGDIPECFALSWSLLDGDRVPEQERPRLEANCAFSADAVAALTGVFPARIVERLAGPDRVPVQNPGVTLTTLANGPLDLLERTVNSFLQCCQDIDRVDRFICIGGDTRPGDWSRLQALYPFFEFIAPDPHASNGELAVTMNRVQEAVATPYWLHLGTAWHFVTSASYISRALSILDHEPEVGQVLFNRNFAERFTDRTIAGGILRRVPATGLRYVMHQHVPDVPARDALLGSLPAGVRTNAGRPHFGLEPSLMRTAAIRGTGRFIETNPDFEREFAVRFTAAAWKSAFFDAVVCMRLGPCRAASGPEASTSQLQSPARSSISISTSSCGRGP